MENQKCYIENRIWYVGYTQINFDAIQEGVVSYENVLIEKYPFGFSSSEHMLYISYTAEKLTNKFINDHYYPTHLEYKFLNNGCVNIVLTMAPKEPENFKQRVERLDEEGEVFYELFSDGILNMLMPLLQHLVDSNIIVCHETSLWGIPSLLSKDGFDIKNLEAFGKKPETMYGTKTLYRSTLYIQHALSNEDNDRKLFLGEDDQPCEEVSLRYPTNKKIGDKLHMHIAWARRYWMADSNEIEDVKYFLEIEAIHLSKTVILSTSIHFNTELSLVLFREKEVRENASIDALRMPNALVRTHLASTEMMTQEFFEASKKFYKKIESFDSNDTERKIKLQEESEETLRLIADSIEMGKDNTRAEWLQFFVVFFSGMTLFSVSQDVASFTLVDASTIPALNSHRVDFILGLFIFITFVLVLFVLPTKIFGWNWKKNIRDIWGVMRNKKVKT